MSEVDDALTAMIATVTAAVPALTGYDHVVNTITPPAVMAFPPDELSYRDTFGGGGVEAEGTMLTVLRLYVQVTQDGTDQQKLNAYISRSGADSVVAALEANPRLGGVVADCEVIQAVNYGRWPIGQLNYLGVELRVRVLLR